MALKGQGLGAKTYRSLKLEIRIGAIPIPLMQG
jgi:hypothetical protein